MVVTSDDGIDAKCDIVNDHGKIVSGYAVASTDDEIIQFTILENNISFDDVLKHRFSINGGFETNNSIVGCGQTRSLSLLSHTQFALRVLGESQRFRREPRLRRRRRTGFHRSDGHRRELGARRPVKRNAE